MTMAFLGPFAVPFRGLVSLFWGLVHQALVGGGVLRGGVSSPEGTSKEESGLSLAQLSLASLGEKGNCPLPEAAP